MQASIKTVNAAAPAVPRQCSLVERLCARVVVHMFLPRSGKRSSLISPQPAASRSWISERSLGLETAKRHVANYARAFAAVIVGCGPLLAAATCVVLLNAIGSTGANTSTRTGNPPGQHEQHEQPERERLEQFISSISYRQRQKSRNLIRIDQLDLVSQLVDFTDQSASAGDRCAICLESSASNQVRILACRHAFHAECIEPWLTKCCGFCPLCKAQLQPKKD